MTELLNPGTCEYDPLWKQNLYWCSQLKMRPLQGALIQEDWCLYKKRHRSVDTQVRLSSDNGGRGWSNASTSPGTARTARNHWKLKDEPGIDSPWIPLKWNQHNTSVLDFQIPKLWENTFLLFQTYPVCGTFVTAALGNWGTQSLDYAWFSALEDI